MSKTLSKEIKAVVSHDFYPQSYMESALESDTRGLGVDGSKLVALRGAYQNMVSDLEDKRRAPGAVSEIRNELIQVVYKALGYYDILALQDREKFSFESKPGQHFTLPIERAFALKNSREAELWLLKHLPVSADQDEDLFPSQISSAETTNGETKQTVSWSDVISNIFDSDSYSVDYLIVSSGTNLYITEKGKWQDDGEVYLQIDLSELYSVNDSDLYRLAEVLTSVKAFPIDSAEFFHNTIAQNAHKKASEVTKALRETVRESIEIIANEVLANHYRKPLSTWKKRDLAKPSDRKLCATELQDQTLRYIYRMLFFLFAESQGRNTLPVESEGYLKGYSIEKLRDFEGKPIAVAYGRQGENNFIQRTLERTTKIYFSGYHNDKIWEADKHTNETIQKTDALGFSFPSLGSDLFDSSRTPLFNEAILSDHSMQRIIEKLSLARVGSGKSARTHRVHYAGLGINQLGAVYEGLLSLNPDILTEKVVLLEQDQRDHAPRVIPYSKRNDAEQEKLQKDDNGSLIAREKGTFILTPVGLERKFSASFYTAEVLTRFVAKEAVEQLLAGDRSLQRMENLRILEPAMGSGAFLNAVVDELAPKMAEEYRKKEVQNDPQSKRTFDYYKAKAKDHLMRNCVYGVDLNPTAVELAKISLWLNCLHEDGNLPFLDFKLRCGNSLIGAWLNRFRTKEDLPHFLFPSPSSLDPHLDGVVLGDKKRPFIESAKLRDKIKALKEDYQSFREKNKSSQRLMNLTTRIDQLYKNHKKARDAYQERVSKLANPTEKEQAFKQFVQTNTAYNQLRAIMDFWCSLWFWPNDKLNDLPCSDEFISILEWYAETPLVYGREQEEQIESSGIKCLSIARDIAFRTRFFHWDLEFCEVLDSGGFDLCIGNPPWAPVKWEEEDFFEENSPGTSFLQGDSKNKYSLYDQLLTQHSDWRIDYRNAFCRVNGYVEFLRASGTYPFKDPSMTNTYKYFYQRFYQLARPAGIHSMIAQDGILTDDKNIEMRPVFYTELLKAFRFINEKKLFDVGNRIFYIVWISKKGKETLSFDLIDNLFLPETVDSCRNESALAPYRGYKDEDGNFELRGHPKRIVNLTSEKLEVLAAFSPGSTATTLSLPTIHGEAELELLSFTAAHSAKLNNCEFYYSNMFHERDAAHAGHIRKDPGKAPTIAESVMTGPNIFVGNPAFQVPNPGCANHRDFSFVDLTKQNSNFYTETVYRATKSGLSSSEYLKKTPWGTIHSNEFRIIGRGAQVNTTGVRTLSSAIIPPGISHINQCFSLSFKSVSDLVTVSGLFDSLFFDFLVRNLGGGTVTKDVICLLPFLNQSQLNNPLIPALQVRALRLSCISEHYSTIWQKAFRHEFKDLELDSNHKPTLPYSKLENSWKKDSCIRVAEEREQVLCEIDAIVGVLFRINKQSLLDIYRSQFGVLQKKLQDLPNQKVDLEKYHFARYAAMANAYEQVTEYLVKAKPRAA